MSDSTKTILWVVLAVVVVIVIVALLVRSSKKRRELDERRFTAVDLRAKAEEKTPVVQERADRASVTEQIAAEARGEADEKVATAASLEDEAREQRAAAQGVESERDDLVREADRVDPDVETNEAGDRVGDRGDDDRENNDRGGDDRENDGSSDGGGSHDAHDLRDQAETETHAETQEPATVADRSEHTEGAAREVLAGASTLDDHDDEPDLADADDPFAGEAHEQGSQDERDGQAEEPADVLAQEQPDRVVNTIDDASDEHDDHHESMGSPDVDSSSVDLGPDTTADERSTERTVDVFETPADDTVRAPVPAPLGSDPVEEDLVETDPVVSDHVVTESPEVEPVDTGSTDAANFDADEADEPQSHESLGEGSDAPDGPDDGEGSDSPERRLSTFDEVTDGGFGIGSAQPIAGGAQPLGHPVKAWHDVKSFVVPGEAGYEGGEPDVWFFNEDAARRAGFSRQGEQGEQG